MTATSIPDPMQNEPTAKLQASVDRARAQCHRLVNRCIAELRKLQTERQVRNETLEAGTDLSHLGLSDACVISKAVNQETVASVRRDKRDEWQAERAAAAAEYQQAMALPDLLAKPIAERFAEYKAAAVAEQTQTPAATPISPVAKQTHHLGRNSRCTCGSGLKYKRCCARKAA